MSREGGKRYPLATVVYAGKAVGEVDHLIVPGVGEGWHTLCGRLWANGQHVSESEWGHRAPSRRPCIPCTRANTPEGSSAPGVTQ